MAAREVNTTNINFVPLGDQLLVRVNKREERRTKTGLILTETSDSTLNSGVVVKLGDVSNYRPNGQAYNFTVKEGWIVYWRYGGTEIEIDGVKYVIIRENDLLGFESVN